jgi:hypothetical protein
MSFLHACRGLGQVRPLVWNDIRQGTSQQARQRAGTFTAGAADHDGGELRLGVQGCVGLLLSVDMRLPAALL